MTQARASGQVKSTHYEFRIVTKTGEIKYVESHGAHTTYRGKQATIGTIIDITERKKAEEALRESENKFRDLTEKSVVGIYVVQDRVFKYINSQCAQILGYEIEDLIDKKGPWDMILPEDIPIVIEELQTRMSGQTKSLHRDFRIVTKTQEIKYVETYGTHTIFQGKPATIGTIIDVTERKRGEEALRASEERFRTLIETSVEVISLVDIDRKRIYVSPSIETVLGYSVEEYRTLKWTDVSYPDEFQMRDENLVWMLKHPGETVTFTSRLRHKDGRWRWMESTARSLLHNPGVRAVVVNFRDITERKEAEEALRKSEEKYRNIFENAVEGIFQATPEGRFLSVNPALARMHGFETPDELLRSIARSVDQLYVNLQDRERMRQMFTKQGVVKAFEAQMHKKDGSTI